MSNLVRKCAELLARWFGAHRAASRLDRDAATILDIARSASSDTKIRETAIQVREALEAAHARGGGDPSRYAPIISHFRAQHREARRRHDDTALTALTLVIIYLRAEKIGPDADPARNRIDAFVSDWTRT